MCNCRPIVPVNSFIPLLFYFRAAVSARLYAQLSCLQCQALAAYSMFFRFRQTKMMTHRRNNSQRRRRRRRCCCCCCRLSLTDSSQAACNHTAAAGGDGDDDDDDAVLAKKWRSRSWAAEAAAWWCRRRRWQTQTPPHKSTCRSLAAFSCPRSASNAAAVQHNIQLNSSLSYTQTASHSTHECGLLTSHVPCVVCVRLCVLSCKSGWTDRDAGFRGNSYWPLEEPCIHCRRRCQLANTTERSVHGCDAALRQITLVTCLPTRLS